MKYLRVWVTVIAAASDPSRDLRGCRMARRVLEGTGVTDIGNDAASKKKSRSATTSWSTKYRKLMRLVHPDALVSLKVM